MTLTQKIWVLSAAALAGGVAFGAGCSSSTTSPPPHTTTTDSGTPKSDSSAPKSDSATTETGTGEDSSGSDAVVPEGDAGGDAAPPCLPGTAPFTAVTYVPAIGHQGVCSATQISAFIAACGFGQNPTMATCATWQAANVGGDAGEACGNCILAPMNNGALWLDPEGMNMAWNGQPNYAGCIQLTDATHGAACGGALNNAQGCEGLACDMACTTAAMSDPNAFPECAAAADMGSCSTYATAEMTNCMADFADGGAAAMCQPSAMSQNLDDDLTFIANLICGGATVDAGGPVDAGGQ